MVVDGIEWTPDGPEDKAQTRRIVNQWEIDGTQDLTLEWYEVDND